VKQRCLNKQGINVNTFVMISIGYCLRIVFDFCYQTSSGKIWEITFASLLCLREWPINFSSFSMLWTTYLGRVHQGLVTSSVLLKIQMQKEHNFCLYQIIWARTHLISRSLRAHHLGCDVFIIPAHLITLFLLFNSFESGTSDSLRWNCKPPYGGNGTWKPNYRAVLSAC
jgi:hypothetical protein